MKNIYIFTFSYTSLQRETQGYRQRFRGGGADFGTKSTAYTDSFIKMDLEKGLLCS